MLRTHTVLLLSGQEDSECGGTSGPRVSAETVGLGKGMQAREASRPVTSRAGLETGSPTWRPLPPAPLLPGSCPHHSRSPGASHPLGVLPLRPSCQAPPEPTFSLQPQKSQAGALSQKAGALEETVASRERRVTEVARTLRATARAVLRKIEPFTQVGSYP